MSRTYVLSRFLRQTPNQLLKQYFTERGLLGTVDFDTPKEREIDAMQDAIIALPEAARQKVEADFRDIDALASERGFRAMMDEAAWHVRNSPQQYGHDYDLKQRLANADGEHARAMWVFLNREHYWHGAMRFFEADMVSPSYWQKRKNLPKLEPRLDAAVITAFAHALGRYFHVMHGRGAHCHVEPLRRNELYYLFCFGQDYAQAPQEWVDGKLDRRPRNPTHEVIFIYSEEEGKLDTFSKGGKREVPDLEAIFAELILGHKKLEPRVDDNRIYDLDMLKDRDFPFTFSADSKIERVVVRALRLSPRFGDKTQFTLRGDYNTDPKSVHEALQKLSRGVPLEQMQVTQAELGIHFRRDGIMRARTVPAVLTYPNRCSLRYDGLDLIARKMLADSGIEPREP
jgi:hypothetical protein